jgi:cell division protein FtsA
MHLFIDWSSDMDEPIIVGIDIGTSKICTLVARIENGSNLRILGVGIEPSQGLRKGAVVDINAAALAVSRSVEKAERTSGFEINAALVSLAGSHVSSINSRGVVGITSGIVDLDDVDRALDAAQAVAIPHNREIIHVIQRGFIVDGQDGIRTPIGMHGYRLEVEAHIITASSSTIENLRQCVGASGIEVSQFVLNPLASGEIVLSETERQMGVAIVDIGAGTTDMAIYIDGDVWHTMVLAVGGNHVTSDIAHGLRMPISQAEEIKIKFGHALQSGVNPEEQFTVRSFGGDAPSRISRVDLANIIEARMEEIFYLVLQEIRRSGYDGLLPAGVVITGGSSLLPGTKELAAKVMGLPARIAKPQNMIGLIDQLNSPSYSTSVGLLEWALLMSDTGQFIERHGPKKTKNWTEQLKDLLRRLLP